MKRADLEKQIGKKIAGRMQHEPHSDRYGNASAQVADKREQRERDKAAGLVPFAVKLPQRLVTQLQALASDRKQSLNDLVAELVAAGLSGGEARDAETAAPAKSRKTRAAKSTE